MDILKVAIVAIVLAASGFAQRIRDVSIERDLNPQGSFQVRDVFFDPNTFKLSATLVNATGETWPQLSFEITLHGICHGGLATWEDELQARVSKLTIDFDTELQQTVGDRIDCKGERLLIRFHPSKSKERIDRDLAKEPEALSRQRAVVQLFPGPGSIELRNASLDLESRVLTAQLVNVGIDSWRGLEIGVYALGSCPVGDVAYSAIIVGDLDTRPDNINVTMNLDRGSGQGCKIREYAAFFRRGNSPTAKARFAAEAQAKQEREAAALKAAAIAQQKADAARRVRAAQQKAEADAALKADMERERREQEAAEALRRTVTIQCQLLKERIANKTIGSLTVAQLDGMEACKKIGVW